MEGVHVGHALFQLYVGFHAEPASGGGGHADVVRLYRARDQEGVGIPGLCLAQGEFELADLVAAHRQPRAVVPFDPQLDAEGRTEAGCVIQRRGRMAQSDPGKLVDDFG